MDESSMPSLCNPDLLCSNSILPIYAQQWPALKDALWCLGVGEAVAMHLGMGSITKLRVFVDRGAEVSMFMQAGAAGKCKKCKGQCLCFRIEGEVLKGGLPKGLWRYAVDKGLMLIGGSIPDAASAVDWTLSLAEPAEKVRLVSCFSVCVGAFLRSMRSMRFWFGFARGTTFVDLGLELRLDSKFEFCFLRLDTSLGSLR
jgi:hypothetical protein